MISNQVVAITRAAGHIAKIRLMIWGNFTNSFKEVV